MQTAIFPSKQTLTVKRIFEDNGNWEQFCLNRKDILRNVEIEEEADVSQLTQVCYDIDNPKTKERELRSLVGAAK